MTGRALCTLPLSWPAAGSDPAILAGALGIVRHVQDSRGQNGRIDATRPSPTATCFQIKEDP